MNQERLKRWMRDWRFWALVIVVLLLITAVTVILNALYQPYRYVSPDVGIGIQQEILTNELTGEFALDRYEQTFLEREAHVPEFDDVPEVIQEVLGQPPNIHSMGGVFGGVTRVVLVRVVAPGQTASQIQPAIDASHEGIALLSQLGAEHFAGISPSVVHIVQEHTVIIEVDPHNVEESVWVGAVASQLHPGCVFQSKWTCILEWMSLQKQPTDQSVIGALLSYHQPIFPGQSYHIGAYCRRYLCVISAQSGYITAGYGGWLAAHEFGHAFGARHPTDQTDVPMGYWCRPNVYRDDVMHRITSQTVSRATLEIMGLHDVEPDSRADINQSVESLTAQIVGQTLTGVAQETPTQHGPCWSMGVFSPHRVMGVQVKIGNGSFQPAQPTDGVWGGYSEGYTFSLAGVQQPVLLTIRANMNGKTVEAVRWYGLPNHQTYLPLIRR